MKKFLHVGFNAREPRVLEWETVFNEAPDWLRYAANCWVLCTARSAESWFSAIEPHLKDGEKVLVCELNVSNSQGWLSKSTWEWIQKTRT